MGFLLDDAGVILTDEDGEPLTDGLDESLPINGAAFSVPQHSLAQVVQRIVSY